MRGLKLYEAMFGETHVLAVVQGLLRLPCSAVLCTGPSEAAVLCRALLRVCGINY